jgi:hypothetical protein
VRLHLLVRVLVLVLVLVIESRSTDLVVPSLQFNRRPMRVNVVYLIAGAIGLAGPACGGGSNGGNGSGATDAADTPPDMAPGPSCAPNASCQAADPSCIGLVDNAGKTRFGLRMSQVDFRSPPVFTKGILVATIGGAAAPNVRTCNLNGTATFSWLLQFDTAAGTLTTGGAKPVADPTQGYSFDNEMITLGGQTFTIQPVTYNVMPDASGAFTVATGKSLNLPLFLDPQGTRLVLLPLRAARLTMATLTSHHNCIGSYNAVGLDPGQMCQPDATHPQFIDGGSFDGYVSLDDADAIVISDLQQTLCVLLSGNAGMYGVMMQTSPVTVCKRDMNNKIVFKGDWCSSTNAAADADCADAQTIKGGFAASSVLIH